MQQQYFKTMNQTNFSCKKINSSKPVNNAAKNNFHSHNSCRDIEFTDQQASYFKARLPADFRLIKLNTDQLQKAKEEVLSSYQRTKSSLEKFQSMKSKKTVKKIQEKAKHINQIHNQKVSSRQMEKSLEPEKQKKIKKQHRLKKRVSHKINDKKQQNHEQMESESEGSQQQFHINELKTIRQVKQEFALKNRKKKQKQKQKQFDDKDKIKEKEKKTLKSNKELIKDANLERVQITENFQQNLAPNQVNLLVKESTKSQKNYFSSPSFPTLSSGLPRHIPLPNDQPEGTVQSNNLRFLFGLPYFGEMTEQIRKLNEKQKNFCTNIIQRLKNHRSSQAFRVPVDPQVQGVPDYYYVVYNPMDLGSITKKLQKDKYQDIYEFHSDINLIFQNSYKYNLRSTKYFEAAVEFEDYYQTLLKQCEDKPEQYARQYIPKQLKPKLATGQLDYTEQTPLKKKKKRQLEQIRNMQDYLPNRYEFIESRRMRGKSKSAVDEHSAFYTHSMVLETVNQFQGQMEMDNQTKNHPNFNSFSIQKQKYSESEIPRVKKMESLKVSGTEENISEMKEQTKQKCKIQQNPRNNFGKIQNDIINSNLKNVNTSFPSVPITCTQAPSILEKFSDQIIEQRQVQINKNNKNSINMGQPKKSMSKVEKNKGKRSMGGMISPTDNDGEENKNEQEKRYSNAQQRVGNEEKQSLQKMEQQEIEQKRAIEQQDENMAMNKVQHQNMHQFTYGHFLNHQGYNSYYNLMHNPHYNNYLMLDRRNIGSDDDYDQMGINPHNYINDMDYENIYPDFGAYYEKFQPYQLANIGLPNNALQHQTKYEPNPTVPKQEIKQEMGKKKKRNIIKFPPKQNPSEIIPFKQQISELKQFKNEQNKKQKKMDNQEKTINKKQVEKNIVEFQPLEGHNQFNVGQKMEKSNANLNKRDKKNSQEQYQPKNPFYNLGYKKIKNSHENITINNINQHPPVYPMKHQSGNSNQNIDINMIIYQNTEHQNYSGSTVASNLPVPSRHPDQSSFTYPQITKKQTSTLNNNPTDNVNIDNANLNKVKSKKSKRKRDQQYQCSSEDEQYNMEEQWKLIRKSQTRQPPRKFKPKIHKQSSKAKRENHKRGRYGKKIQPSIFDKNSLNLSNTEQTKNVHQNQTTQNSNKQHLQGSKMLAGNKDLQKIVKFQEEAIPKNIFIESEHESSHFSKRELNLQDYMGQFMNHEEEMIARSKEILEYSVYDRKQSKLLKEENIYQDECSQEKLGQSLDNRGQYGDMEAQLKQIQEN